MLCSISGAAGKNEKKLVGISLSVGTTRLSAAVGGERETALEATAKTCFLRRERQGGRCTDAKSKIS